MGNKNAPKREKKKPKKNKAKATREDMNQIAFRTLKQATESR